ncbi:TetR/AcrR family transcriptional regulator [Devosia sp. 2618]|uniref:TetR/AcrR family transcriptional regulator n=1 Tax=Devosia sp. 2618 TaxID=3156454 RepID=UPI00339B216D
MKVSREQASKNRAHVVDVAGEQFRAHGFDGIGVADLMKAAGLTHGGFYANFGSKDDLAAEAATHALLQTTERLKARVTDAPQPLDDLVDVYLSATHRDDLADGCVLAALASDAARGSDKLKASFEGGVEGYLDLLLPMMSGTTEADRREQAMGALSTLIGGLILSRTVVTPELSKDLLAAAGKAARTNSR